MTCMLPFKTNQGIVGNCLCHIVLFQKISIPDRRDWNFLGGGRCSKTENLKNCMKLNWNFQRGGGGGGGRGL